tara:strand:- start:2154 stop:2780 length:627 start_codon:yes stop_codon:yes gene_type:complete
MNTQTFTTTTATGRSELHLMLDNLTSILDQELNHSRKLTEVLRRRVEAEDRDDFNEREQCLGLERESLSNLAMVERERIAAMGEISLVLGCRRAKTMRIAELILYVEPEYRDELLDVRDMIRDCAEEIEALNSANAGFQRFCSDGMDLYIPLNEGAPVDLEEVLNSAGGQPASASHEKLEVSLPQQDPFVEEMPKGMQALFDDLFGED